MGRGATNTLERVAASLGELIAVKPQFTTALDISSGGVLLALPALLASGLLQNLSAHFQLPKGYYGLDSIFLLLALMALARIKNIEGLRYCAPGEWGKLLGLDRIPEVRTLREKIGHLSETDQAEKWSAQLCSTWMQAELQDGAILYVDGHVRVYHGSQTELPRHYVAREKLCLRATCDYWINALDGRPFFYINKAIDPGLLQVLEHDIVPRIEKDISSQCSTSELEQDVMLHRYTLIFDREGYSPDFMLKMKKKRIAVLTYHKHPGDDWSIEEFKMQLVELISGEKTEVNLAERGTFIGEKLWVREIRKLSKTGHQTSIIATDYRSELGRIAVYMVNRWCQENFFKYMREHYNLDRLVDYNLDKIPETTRLVNPTYREMGSVLRRQQGRMTRLLAEFGAIHLDGEIGPKKVEMYQLQKANLHEEINTMKNDIERLKSKRKEIPSHITMGTLPQEKQFSRLATKTKQLIDTIKMIAYRAETIMVNVLREKMSRHDDARSLIRGIYTNAADLIPDTQAKTLTIQLHTMANQSSDTVLKYLCEEMNATETIFPGTDLQLIYKIGSN